MFWARAKAVLRYLFRQSVVDQDLDEEIRSHIEADVNAKISRGMSPDEARRNALLEFGGKDQVKELVRERRTGGWIIEKQCCAEGASLLSRVAAEVF